jgi:hypothetical protein
LRLPSPYEPPQGGRGSTFTLPPLGARLQRHDGASSSRGPPLSPPPTAPLPPLPSLTTGSAIPFSRHPGRTIGMATTPEGYPDIFGQYSFPTEPGGVSLLLRSTLPSSAPLLLHSFCLPCQWHALLQSLACLILRIILRIALHLMDEEASSLSP